MGAGHLIVSHGGSFGDGYILTLFNHYLHASPVIGFSLAATSV